MRVVSARLHEAGHECIHCYARPPRFRDSYLQQRAMGKELPMSPQGIIPVAAALSEGPSAEVIHASVPLLWKLFVGAGTTISGALGWLYVRLWGLEKKHDEDMRGFIKMCGERHEREYSRFTDAATKGDVKIIHDKIDIMSENIQDIQNNMQDINNNIIMVMGKKND